MSGTTLDAREREAGTIVAERLGGRLVDRDGAEGAHDFDVVLPDGRNVALEVTSAADESIESLIRAGVTRQHFAPTLTHDWWLGLPYDGSVEVSKVRAKAPRHLAVLEASGRTEVGGILPAHRRAPANASEHEVRAIEELFSLGVDFARRLGTREAGENAELLVTLHGGSGSDFAALYRLIESRAEAKAPKLIAAGGAERHLFVWMRASASDAELAFATLAPPEVPPDLPQGIDVLWLASPATTPGALWGRLWRLQPPGGWELIAPPSREDDPSHPLQTRVHDGIQRA
jgi:hypothetical protein